METTRTNYDWEALKGTDHSEGQGVDYRITLKCIL
jgi:hypothetical protein